MSHLLIRLFTLDNRFIFLSPLQLLRCNPSFLADSDFFHCLHGSVGADDDLVHQGVLVVLLGVHGWS